jgi:hypothetical protein
MRRFGKFTFTPDPLPSDPEHVHIDSDWTRRNLVTVIPPWINRSVTLHRLALVPFMDLIADWQAHDLFHHVHTWNGTWNPRFKRGRAGGGYAALSNHAWGTAFDINAKEYPLGKPVPKDSPMWLLAEVAEKHGWFYGGHFRSRFDGMHFEFVG